MPLDIENNNFFSTREVELEGHLIDSMILPRVWDRIMELKGDFEIIEFNVGKRKTDTSYIRMTVKGKDDSHLEKILDDIYLLGAVPRELQQAQLQPAPSDKVLPDEFYSTTNHPTFVYYAGKWIEVEDLRMDKVIVVDPNRNRTFCKPIGEVKKGELVVVGEVGVKIKPPERPRESIGVFKFMGSDASTERPSTTIIRKIAIDIAKIKRLNGKIVAVAGPAIIHTGAAEAFANIIRLGFIDAILAGNALAVHDVEAALYGTSLGVILKEGFSSLKGTRNHMAAINEIFKAGSLKEAVRRGILRNGIMYECIRNNIPVVLAGSIRDDGPLPDVIIDIGEAQKKYREALKGTDIVLMFATTLHSIAVGNMLPSNIKVICVDINPSAVTKLLDRGSMQTIGVISDIGVFLPVLSKELEMLKVES